MTIRRKVYFLALWAMGLLIGAAGPAAPGQNYTPSYAPAPPVTPDQSAQPAYTADQLDQMLGPIALYPDPLLSEVLAACTYPQDVAALGQWLQNNPSPSDDAINGQPWDDSVKAIAHYPDVVQMMAGSMDWTEALGAAFANQQQDVMDSVQRLRGKAQAAGTLANTPQQNVVADNGAVEILPAQPDVIYVPQYDPDVVYASPLYPGPWVTFDTGWPVGLWFNLGWNWHDHFIDRGVRWGRDWRHPDFGGGRRWVHDNRRPIPAPRHQVVVPSRSVARPGTGQQGRPLSAFNPSARTNARPAARAPATPGQRRPVTGLPAARPTTPTPRVTPAPREVPTPRTVAPAPTRTPAPPAARNPAAPRAAPTPVIPRSIAPTPAAPRTIGRPVTGLPVRPAPAPRVAPEPRAAPEPRVAPAPMQREPSPAFRPDGGGAGASDRGHQSMRR